MFHVNLCRTDREMGNSSKTAQNSKFLIHAFSSAISCNYLIKKNSGKHWWNISSFSVKILVKNFLHFSHFFHWKSMWKIQNFFSAFYSQGEKFEMKSKSTEKVLKFSHTFSVKKSVQMKEVFHQYFHWKTWNAQPVYTEVEMEVRNFIPPFTANGSTEGASKKITVLGIFWFLQPIHPYLNKFCMDWDEI